MAVMACARTRAATLETSTAIEREEAEGRDIVRVADREGVERRQEEEVVAERGGDAGKERRPQAEAHRDGDDRRQEDEVDILDAEPAADQLADAERARDGERRDEVGPGIERFRPFRGAHRLARNRLAGDLVAGDDVNADRARAAHEIVDDRAVDDLEPSRSCRLADDDLGDVVGAREGEDVVGDPPRAARNGHRLAAERFGEPQACRRCGRAPPWRAAASAASRC